MEDQDYLAFRMQYAGLQPYDAKGECLFPEELSDRQLVALAFMGLYGEATTGHIWGLREIGKRLSQGEMNGEGGVAAIALVLLLNAEEPLKTEALRQLNKCHDEIFRIALREAAPSSLLDMLKIREKEIPAEKLVVILQRVGAFAIRGKFSPEQAEMASKAIVPFLDSLNEGVLFEAAYAAKELKSVYAYPKIITLLKGERELPIETKRVLRSAAENVAICITEETMQTTRGFRGRGWNERLFARMAGHREMLHNLEHKVPMQEKNKVR